MGRKRVELAMSVRETVILLLLLAGAVLWTFPDPDVGEESDRVYAGNTDARIIEHHNATASQDVQKLSELASRDYRKAASGAFCIPRAQAGSTAGSPPGSLPAKA